MGRVTGPVQVAWLLENIALDLGWPVGHSLGSERDFIERFGAGRDVVRGAVRLVEARGLMQMRRGCKGGLRVLRPDIENVAGAFATYLKASGYSRAKLEVAVSIVTPLLGELGCEGMVSQLLQRIGALIAEDSLHGPINGARAEIVALRLLRQTGSPIPIGGVPLGNEATICAAFRMGHRTFRQTLCVLDDLEMLQVKRGRRGGYWLKRPAAIGVTRRLFALLASHGARAADVEPVIWALGIANLRLAFRRMEVLDASQRAQWCDQLATSMHGSSGLRRWVTFQKGLTQFADDLVLSTVTSSMLAYLGRVGHMPHGYEEFERRLLDAEGDILRALQLGQPSEAERHLRVSQTYMSHKA